MERVPDVRLRTRSERLLRGGDTLTLHAGVCGSPSALRPVCRLVKRDPWRRRQYGRQPSTSDRVQQAEPQLHLDEQA